MITIASIRFSEKEYAFIRLICAADNCSPEEAIRLCVRTLNKRFDNFTQELKEYDNND